MKMKLRMELVSHRTIELDMEDAGSLIETYGREGPSCDVMEWFEKARDEFQNGHLSVAFVGSGDFVEVTS